MTSLERARRAVSDLIASYQEAATPDEREAVAKLIALLTPNGGRSLTELAEDALLKAVE